MGKRKKIVVEESSGNVFADLGLPNPEERKTKVWLSVLINRILQERGLTQAQAARLLGITQPKVSALQNCKLEGFSVARLMNFATALDYDVVIELRPRAAAKGAGRVVVAVAA
jgi:predicted XRE-type DNA-binding protein